MTYDPQRSKRQSKLVIILTSSLTSSYSSHCYSFHHMYSKVKVGESEMCPCNADIMTAEDLLQHCHVRDALRRGMWPEPVPLRDKLYGNLEELRRTDAFMRATGISV